MAFGWLWELACSPRRCGGAEAGAAALVKLLALSPGRRMLREQVMELLWPELDPRAAGANLRKAIHHARRALDGAEGPRVLTSRGGLVGWAPEVSVDVDEFLATVARARRAGDTADYAAAVSLYGDGLLPEEPL